MNALATIHIGCKQLGLDEDMRRDVYERITGLRSAKAMSDRQRRDVVDELRRLGFKPHSNGRRNKLEGRYAAKLQALWIAGWNLGLVRNRDDKALLAFVKRQTGIDHTRFLHYPQDAAKAIEALKAWMARDAGVIWKTHAWDETWYREPPARIVEAQVKILKNRDPDFPPSIEAIVSAEFITTPRMMNANRWIELMNRLGEMIRARS